VALTDIPQFIQNHYEVYEWRHASAVLCKDFPQEWNDIMAVLSAFRLKRSYIDVGGGSKTDLAQFIDTGFTTRGWVEKKFDTRIIVDNTEAHSPTHKVDEYKNHVAVEVEWNNKDPFFDRDLNNFRLLFDLRVISVGVIITRTDELQKLFKTLGIGGKYGQNTTHMSQLLKRLEGGGGGGCPVLVFGIKRDLYEDDIIGTV